MESDRIALKTLGLATAGVIGIEALTRGVIGQGWLAPLAGTALARLLDIAWMAMVISRCTGGWAHMGLARGSWKPGLLKGLVWSAEFGAAAVLGWGLLHALGIDSLRFLQPSPAARPANMAALFLVGGVIGPVAEEFYFRGLIYGYSRRWGFWPALGLSTLIFTLLHTGASAVPIPQIVGGLVFASAYEIEKKLLVPITIHVLGNLALFSVPYVFRL
jgi:uncharacterized protein